MQPRLKKRWEFVRVAQKGGYCPASTVIVQYLSHTYLPPEKAAALSLERTSTHYVGFTASRKTGGAVARNRAKRRLREAFEQVYKDIQLDPCDIVIIAKKTAVTAPFEHLLRDLKYAIKKCIKESKPIIERAQ